MALQDRFERTMLVRPEHLELFRFQVDELGSAQNGHRSLLVDAMALQAVAARSGDRYLWHLVPGSSYQDSPFLRERMQAAGIDEHALLAHGVLGLTFALRTAYLASPDRPIDALQDVRFTAPVFEGAHITADVESEGEDIAGFTVTTDQLQPDLAIVGHMLYGDVAEHPDGAFRSLAEQQLFSIEEVLGGMSAMLGMSVEAAGARVLYMGQQLGLSGLVQVDDRLDIVGEVVSRKPSRHGERIAADVRVTHTVDGHTRLVATGETLFLYIE